MREKSLLNEKAIIILSLNQSECRKLLRSASSRIISCIRFNFHFSGKYQ